MTTPTRGSFTPQSVRAALRLVEAEAVASQMYPILSPEIPRDFPAVGKRLRGRRRGEADQVSSASLLLNDQGVLLWHGGHPASSSKGRRARRGVPPAPEGELIELYQYQALAPNEIMEQLVDLDVRLNTHVTRETNAAPELVQLLRDSKTGQISRSGPIVPSGKKRRLLFVHGTFSKTESFFDGFAKAANGASFVKWIFASYDEVLAFDHATLSVGPILNAFDLVRLLHGIAGPLDVIAHSRGGLVVRWAIEGFGLGSAAPCRGILVGCPINGTSLASPPKLRTSLSLLTNIGTAMQLAGSVASAYLPLLIAPVALVKVATSIVSVAAKTPLIDAAVQMIPGLLGQSRVGNSADLGRLRAVTLKSPPTYYVVRSDFEPEAPGWKFWKWFNKGRIANAGADLIFKDQNDLVVDTASMTEFSGTAVFPPARLHDFKTNATVHHCSYFEQADTLRFIQDQLKI